MVWLYKLGCILLLSLELARTAAAGETDVLYMSKTIVTGQGEKNRQAGFRDCLDRVLLRVSGDQSLTSRPEMAALLDGAGSFVQSFSYRDRLAGRPVHDEQGTYDRPHDLTCRYDPEVIDGLLADLGSRPWRSPRPSLAILLEVQREGKTFHVSRDSPRDGAMRESFALGAAPLAMSVIFPSADDAEKWTLASSDLGEVARMAGGDRPLIGKLVWNDAALGWIASWRISDGTEEHTWMVQGVNFDEAFRVAIRGAAQILSGNGAP